MRVKNDELDTMIKCSEYLKGTELYQSYVDIIERLKEGRDKTRKFYREKVREMRKTNKMYNRSKKEIEKHNLAIQRRKEA